MKRELILKLTIDTDIWEQYDNISDELLFQDWLDSINISVRGAELELLSEKTDLPGINNQ